MCAEPKYYVCYKQRALWYYFIFVLYAFSAIELSAYLPNTLAIIGLMFLLQITHNEINGNRDIF